MPATQRRRQRIRLTPLAEPSNFPLVKPFKRTYIEITIACNLSCDFCPGTFRPTQFMAVNQFDEILTRLGNYSKHVYFHVLGEPLLHPDLGSLLDRAHGHGKLVNLVTNGTLIGDVGATLVSKPALRQVTFSMHSLATHPTLRATLRSTRRGASPLLKERGSLVQGYFDPILDFTRMAQKDHFICYRLWPQDEGADAGAYLDLLACIEKAFTLTFSLAEKLKTASAIPLDKNVFLNQSRRFDWPDRNGQDLGEQGFCLGLREQFAVLVDGTVVPCCLDRNADMALGNIFNQPIEEILEGERARSIVEGFSQRKVVEELCRRCGYRKRFD
jgi:radical SAM protein with 4Fe4S-binding SPASM domain